MKAMILAAGLGTRLRPWTLEHPKALVPVDGVPMLQRVIEKLKSQGFQDIVVNIHHFGEQIIDFLANNDMGVNVSVSDERGVLLDTGGGILNASGLLDDADSFLVHNVDILSSADLAGLVKAHSAGGNDITLLTSGRDSSRKLIFDAAGGLVGWHNCQTDDYRPESFEKSEGESEEAFSGIYVMGGKALYRLKEYSTAIGTDRFPIMDFLLWNVGAGAERLKIRRVYDAGLKLLDIGKPAALARAPELLNLIEDSTVD